MFTLLTQEDTQFISDDSMCLRGRAAQMVTCQIADTCLTADSGATSSFSSCSHTFVEI